ncbi:hypothetical protein [Candidatus Viadribacter manganicus]|uniref:Uncharacterized protein n=1 Tax=Candidatus Viadribacter manganicus TaxID=1759059 RepID=A0A1B1AD33_9PROT|nr:hypothetical protein [Candidatus Viadribacter manganicus]ANP44466.1 hypothetical protein ATE48_00280 [Candidatus Viadribacter manganicus]
MHFAGTIGVLSRPQAAISAAWSAISVAWPAVTSTNEDRAITWAGALGSRTVVAEYSGSGTISYRVNGGAWTVGPSVSITSGQTVGWRIQFAGSENLAVPVKVDSVLLTSFQAIATGFP